MDNFNNINSSDNIDNESLPEVEVINEQPMEIREEIKEELSPCAPSTDNVPPPPVYAPKQSKAMSILTALAKCVLFLFIWLGVQFVLVQIAGAVIMMQNPSISQEALQEEIYKYALELTVDTNLIALIIFFVIYLVRGKSLLKKINISLPDKSAYGPVAVIGATGQLVTAMILGVLMNVLNLFPEKWVDELNEASGAVSNGSPLLSFFAVVILAPVFEEILCRGLILGTLKKVMPKWYAIVISASIFGIIHGNPIQFIYATAVGILLGWLYTKYESILVPMLCHLAFNLISTLVGYIDPENMVAAAILGLIMYASVPLFVLAIIHINKKKIEKKAEDVAEIPVFVPAIPVNNTPEYNASVIAKLEEQIEGINTEE